MNAAELADRADRAAQSLLARLEIPPALDASTLSLVRSAVSLGWVCGYSAAESDARLTALEAST
jgi:hypothetical protein